MGEGGDPSERGCVNTVRNTETIVCAWVGGCVLAFEFQQSVLHACANESGPCVATSAEIEFSA